MYYAAWTKDTTRNNEPSLAGDKLQELSKIMAGKQVTFTLLLVAVLVACSAPDDAPDICGDSQITGAEECDGALLGGETCITQGYNGGTLACVPDTCILDVSMCDVCGDAQATGTEECDDQDLREETCQSQGYEGGTLVCAADTCTLDRSLCSNGATALTTGESHTCALLDTGAMRCWGRADWGQLGYGSALPIGDNEFPDVAGDVPVGSLAAGISAGRWHTCALLGTGSLRCWGNGDWGQLGYGNRIAIGDDELPDTVGDVPLGGSAVTISAGQWHTCAVLDTGAVRCWGINYAGQLGYGNTIDVGDDEFPDAVGDVPLGGTAVAITAGYEHTCALLDTGAVRCWGYNGFGQLGYGHTSTIGDDEPPDAVGEVALGGTAVSVTAGNLHTCALLDTGAVRCWGAANDGQLGYGNTTHIGDDELPGSAGDVSLGGLAVAVSAGSKHTCAVLDTGAVRCWGLNENGQLGYGNTGSIGDNELPSDAGDVSVGGVAVAVAVGDLHTCVLLETGAIRCWGGNDRGQLGYGNNENIGDDEIPSDAGDVPFL